MVWGQTIGVDSMAYFMREGFYSRAIFEGEKNLKNLARNQKPGGLELANALCELGIAQSRGGKPKEAEDNLSQSAQLLKKAGNGRQLEMARVLWAQSYLFRIMGKAQEAEKTIRKSLEIRKKNLGPGHALVAESVQQLGVIEWDLGHYEEAEQLFFQALEMRNRAFGNEAPEVSETCFTLGFLYWEMDKFSDAERYFNQSLSIRKAKLQPFHPDLGTTYNNLGLLYWSQGQDEKALPFFLKAYDILKQALGMEHPRVAGICQNLGILHQGMGNYTRAEPFFWQALEIQKSVFGEENPDVGRYYNNLGVFFKDKGDFVQSEEYYLKALEIQIKTMGENHVDVARTYSNLGIVSEATGNFSKAENYHLKALQARIKVQGELHSDVAESYQNLGNIYRQVRDFKKSTQYLYKTMEIKKKLLGDAHPDLAGIYQGLGLLSMDFGGFMKAEGYFRKALEIRKLSLNSHHPEMAQTQFLIGRLQRKTRNYPAAQRSLTDALEIRQKTLGSQHFHTGETWFELGLLFWEVENMARAGGCFEKAASNFLFQIQRNFQALSDREKENFVEKLSPMLETIKAYYVKNQDIDKSMAGLLFNLQIQTKAILLSSSKKWKQSIRNSTDTGLVAKFEQWENWHNRLARLISSTDSSDIAETKGLLERVEGLEKELYRKSDFFQFLAEDRHVNWSTIQKKIKQGEAVIEMVRLPKFGISHILVDTTDPEKISYPQFGLTDTAQYAVLVLNQGLEQPSCFLMPGGNQFEEKHFAYYKNTLLNQLEDKLSYNWFWGGLSKILPPAVKKVYFSPDGIYNRLSLQVLQNPKSKKYLFEETNIELLSQSKDLLEGRETISGNQSALVVASPDFNWQGSPTPKPMRNSSFSSKKKGEEMLAELPGTKSEALKIREILQNAGWQTDLAIGPLATEEQIKSVNNPGILHIATHAYFNSQNIENQIPMVNSGLYLAGANRTLNGEGTGTKEDGILNAYEAMNLHLDNTNLVVLSACETGLGDVRNGEGAYGLQRAILLAGAQTVIMSLWKVDDESTQELMVSFYKHWLSGKKVSKHQALEMARADLKSRKFKPYDWGAFVIIGRE